MMQKSMISAPAIVVNAAAKIDGPTVYQTKLVREEDHIFKADLVLNALTVDQRMFRSNFARNVSWQGNIGVTKMDYEID